MQCFLRQLSVSFESDVDGVLGSGTINSVVRLFNSVASVTMTISSP